ncbi:8019_t:CDS:2 [Paraglomus brasilianum]|uniref:8019_t:CDS:1 n=1 Tax=Paraglomus brasilianum TaxID=144538 RepID=A0A9N9DNT4_9GLOM|nr:8019_t:CDS:2 [Paraglomus brasilianum]
MDISSGISSYFSSTKVEAWGYMGCLEHLAKVCAHLTSGDYDEILDKYKNHLFSIISSTSSLKKAKDKALRLNDTAERSFQRIEVTSFFKRLDTQSCQDLVDAKEKLYESKLKSRAYDRFVESTDAKNDRSSKRLRQETIISEEDKKKSDTNTVPKADDDNFDAHSFIVDLSLSSKIRGQFSNEEWANLVKRRPDAMDLLQARKKCLDAFELFRNPLQNDCHEREWTGELDGNFYVPWGEISVLASLRRRNNDKDILIEQLERSHQVDLLCNYEQYEIACALACGGPYSYNLTKLASDEFNLPRIMKDMLDDLELKLLKAGKDQLRPYIIGIQSYMTEIRVYLMERREIYFLHHLKSFNLPLTFPTYHYLKVALRVAWNIRGLVNSLVRELEETIINDDNDGFKTPPTVLSNNMKTNETPPKQPKKKKTEN